MIEREEELKEVEVEVCASGDSCLLRLVLYIYLSHNTTLLRTHRTELLEYTAHFRHSQMAPLKMSGTS